MSVSPFFSRASSLHNTERADHFSEIALAANLIRPDKCDGRSGLALALCHCRALSTDVLVARILTAAGRRLLTWVAQLVFGEFEGTAEGPSRRIISSMATCPFKVA
jgi:hypothetical protein